eukprot:10568310-Lingulodinium_polyedra.AAC.1
MAPEPPGRWPVLAGAAPPDIPSICMATSTVLLSCCSDSSSMRSSLLSISSSMPVIFPASAGWY